MALTEAHTAASLPAQDLDRAKAFYEEKLGLRPVELHRGLFYEFPDGSRFQIFPSEGQPSGTHTQLTFMVKSVPDEMERLRKNGVQFEQYDSPAAKTDSRGITYIGGTRAAFIKDSEGNLIAIVEIGWWNAPLKRMETPASPESPPLN